MIHKVIHKLATDLWDHRDEGHKHYRTMAISVANTIFDNNQLLELSDDIAILAAGEIAQNAIKAGNDNLDNIRETNARLVIATNDLVREITNK